MKVKDGHDFGKKITGYAKVEIYLIKSHYFFQFLFSVLKVHTPTLYLYLLKKGFKKNSQHYKSTLSSSRFDRLLYNQNRLYILNTCTLLPLNIVSISFYTRASSKVEVSAKLETQGLSGRERERERSEWDGSSLDITESKSSFWL